MNQALLYVLLAILSVGGILSAVSSMGLLGEVSLEAALVVENLAARAGPSELKRLTPEPTRTRLHFQVADRKTHGDLYRLEAEPLAGLMLIPGAERQGTENPLLVSFATTLARVRFAVFVPAIPGLSDLKVRPDDIREINDAFAYFRSRPEIAPRGHTGLGGISYSVGPAILAAMQPNIREDVSFLFGVGGYYDLREVINFFTTGYYRNEDQWQYLEPNPYGKWVFVMSMIESLTSSNDRELFRKMVERKLADREAKIQDLAEQLTSEGRSLYRLATTKERERIPELIAQLPTGVRNAISQLNLAEKDLSTLKADVILIHSQTDDIIPYPQSEKLSRALASDQAQLFLIEDFGHVELERLDREQVMPMLQAIEVLLAQRKPAPEDSPPVIPRPWQTP